MIGSITSAGSVLPGSTVVLRVQASRLPKLVPIMIQVAVPGPA